MFATLKAKEFMLISKKELFELVRFFKSIKVLRRNGIMILTLLDEVDHNVPSVKFEEVKKGLSPGREKYKLRSEKDCILIDCRALAC